MYQEKDNIFPAMIAVAKTIASRFPASDFIVKYYEEKKTEIVKRKLNRLEELYNSLLERLTNIEGEINSDYVCKEDFEDIFERTASYIMNERINDKRRCFQNIFINSITASFCSYDKTEKYMRMLDSMGWLELRILGVLNNPSKYNEDEGYIIKDSPNDNSFWGAVLSGKNSMDILAILLKESKEDIMDALYYLENNRLIIKQSNAIHTQFSGNSIHILENMLTPKGKEFVAFIMQK